jgi:hypothetical protein
MPTRIRFQGPNVYGVVVNHNTNPHASIFFKKIERADSEDPNSGAFNDGWQIGLVAP